MFADDCTIILNGTEQSYNATIYLFEEFGKLSGLTLNFSKCIALKIGSLRNQHDLMYVKKKGIIWNTETPKALGIIFHPQINHILDLNYQPRINNFYKDIAIWNRHKLTTIGNISVFKSFILSKLTYLFSVLPDPPEDTLKTLQQKSFEFIWNSKRDKIKRNIVIKSYEDGGLKMTNIHFYINSINITWVKRLIDPENNRAWKTPYMHEMSKFGGLLFFKCNFSVDDIKSLKIKNTFLKDVLYSWCLLNHDKDPKNINSQLLWNNSFIKHQSTPIVFLEWINKNILYIRDIFDFDNKRVKRFSELQNEFGLPNRECLNYHKMIASIPKTWIKKLKTQPNENDSDEISLFKILAEKEQSNICQYITNFQIKHCTNTEKPKPQTKWEAAFPEKSLNWKEIYSKVFDTFKDNKLQNFQYNFTHRNIATNKYLLKCKYAASSLCTFCNMAVESIDHLFWECDLIQYFWNNLFDVLAQCNLNVARNKFDVFLYTKSQILSYIYSFAKFYIYQCKFKNVIPNIDAFKTKLRYRKILEQHIAIKNDKVQEYNDTWNSLQGL